MAAIDRPVDGLWGLIENEARWIWGAETGAEDRDWKMVDPAAKDAYRHRAMERIEAQINSMKASLEKPNQPASPSNRRGLSDSEIRHRLETIEARLGIWSGNWPRDLAEDFQDPVR